MSIKENLKNPFVQQSILEILLPICGYFFFDWSMTIIAVFYLLDQFAAELLYFRRLHWINIKSNDVRVKGILFFAISSFVILMGIELFTGINLWLNIFSSDVQLMKSDLINFAKDELWLLFPLLAFMYHIKDQFTFYAPRRYLNYNSKKSLIYHTISTVVIVALIILGLFFWTLIEMNEITALFSFIILKLIHDLLFIRWLDKKSLNN